MPRHDGPAALQVALKFLVADIDRRGNLRRYVRVPGRRKVRLRCPPGTEEFHQEYLAAIAGLGAAAGRAARGSFRALCILYYGSAAFRALDRSTQDWQRRGLDGIAQKDGHKPVALMRPRHVRRLRNELAATPAAANHRRKALKALFAWAVEEEQAAHDPTLGVRKLRYAAKPFHTATEDEIAQYRARHPLGGKARLALELLRYTSGRREDIPRLGPQHIKDGRVRFRQAKNEHRRPVEIDMPLHPVLAAAIAATPSSGHLTFLVTAFAKPYSAAGFGNAMRDWFDQANLPHCSAHSVRKGTLTELADNEATPHGIMAVGGHSTLEEVENYTRKANRKKLADQAMAKLK